VINRNKILNNIIELQNITVFQQRNKVFDNFSLSLEKGENTVILGPNGAGKTTLLKLLNRELYIVEMKIVVSNYLEKVDGTYKNCVLI